VQIELPDQTVRDVQALLAERGESVDVSAFVNQTLRRALFFDTVREVKRQNASVDPAELDRLIDDAVKAVRVEGRRATPDAAGA
jgi:Arc/MetJ-type ribon-helix-helix transcriptional regulator